MLTLRQLIEQLVKIYFEKENWHQKKLDKESAEKYFEKMLSDGVITYCEKENKIVGYEEIWLITAKQLNKIKNHKPFSAMDENITKGTIGFLANVWIDPKYRHNEVAKKFKKAWNYKTKNCNLFTGMRNNKLLKIHRRNYGK